MKSKKLNEFFNELKKRELVDLKTKKKIKIKKIYADALEVLEKNNIDIGAILDYAFEKIGLVEMVNEIKKNSKNDDEKEKEDSKNYHKDDENNEKNLNRDFQEKVF